MTIRKFMHHYLFDTIFNVVLLLSIVLKGMQLCLVNDHSMMSSIAITALICVAFELFYWLVFRKLYIKALLRLYIMHDRVIIRHIENRGIKRYRRQNEKVLDEDATYEGLSESKRNELLKEAINIYKAKALREQEMKAETEKKLKRVKEYTKQTLLMLNFSAEDIFKICNYVEFFVTTHSVIQTPTSIAKLDDVSISELKNLIANIADQYGIDNTTTAKFVAEVFKEWCVWQDADGKQQTTEVSTIAKTLRTNNKKLRVLPTTDI